MIENAAQEVLCTRMLGCAEHVLGLTLFNDDTTVEKKYTVSYVAGKAHLVRHHQHGEPLIGKTAHDIEHIAHQFRIERRRGLIERIACGRIAKARAIATRCI